MRGSGPEHPHANWLLMAGIALLITGALCSADRIAIWLGHEDGFGVANQRGILALRVLVGTVGVILVFLRRRSWMIRTARHVAVFTVLWTLLECTAWVSMRLLHPTTEETGTSVLFVHGQPQGFRLRPNARAICTRTLDRDTIYSVTCTIDSTGGRKTRQPKVYSERTVVFLGCSFTFGTGVDDDQTLPAWYAQIDTSARVLNRAVPGYGPQNWWLQFKEKEMAPLIHSDSVLFILPIIDGHLARAVGSMQVYSTWGENLPYCRLEDDQIAQYGTFTTGRPFTSTLYWMLYKSPVVRFLGIDLPATRSEGSLKLMKALLEGTARMAREQHPRSRFLVLLYPGMTTAPYFVEHLDREWLEVFDLSTMSWQNEHRIPHDPHPSATGHARVARSIAGHVHHQQPIVGGYVP